MTELARRDTFPTVEQLADSPAEISEVHPGHALARALRLSQRRAAWFGRALAEQIEVEGVGGVVGDQLVLDDAGAAVKVSEYVRQLAELEHRERATVAKLAETVARLGIDATAAAGSGPMVPVTTTVEWIGEVVTALGHDWSDDGVRRVAQRALIDARRSREQSAS